MADKTLRQRNLRGHRVLMAAVSGAEHKARLARRLTARDKWLLHMLWEHKVFTINHIATMAFPSLQRAQRRMKTLTGWALTDRFQPFISSGSSPMYYVLGPAGAAVLAAESGTSISALKYRRDKALGIAHSHQLAHAIGRNGFFATCAASSLTGARLTDWWSERRCGKAFGNSVLPDGFGRWTAEPAKPKEPPAILDFFLEYDTGSESHSQVSRKLDGYMALAQNSQIITPVLFLFLTAERETNARDQLRDKANALANPASVPIATSHTHSPLGGWLPLEHDGPHRDSLTALTTAWPHRTTPKPASKNTGNPSSGNELTAPTPIAPPPDLPAH